LTTLWELFSTFARIGALTFGGGYAMLPMIQREVVEKHRWATDEEVMDYYAVGQCTPGVIAVNTATFIGYKERGILGGIFATAGVIAPSVVIIIAIAALLQNFADNEYVRHAFAGINVAVAALIVQAVIKLAKGSVVDWLCLAVAVAAFAVTAFTGVSPIYVVAVAAILGILGRKLKIEPFAKKKEADK